MKKADNKFEEVINIIKNRPIIVILLIIFVIVVGLGTFTDSIDKILEFYNKHFPTYNNSKELKPELLDKSNIQGEATLKKKVSGKQSEKGSKGNTHVDGVIKTSGREKQEDNMKENIRPKLWITYAWEDNADGNFDFLIKELEKVGVDTIFDKVALIPGQRLWEQIADRIEDPSLNGWAILLTKQSIESQACKEEVAYALDRALRAKGKNFPLIGLIHQIGIKEVPASLRVRLLIDLRDHRWPQKVLAGLRGVAPGKKPSEVNRYVWETLPNFRGPETIAITVHPRFGELHNWRFIYPEDANLIDWGSGPPNKHGFTGSMTMRVEDYRGTLTGPDDLAGTRIKWVGAGNVITPGSGCYIVFGKPLPKFVGFAIANEPLGPPSMESFEYITIPYK